MIRFTTKEFLNMVKFISEYYQTLVQETSNKRIAGTTNEWLLDNYYVISEQEKSIRGELKDKSFKSIPLKRKKHLYNLLLQSMQKTNFQIDTNIQLKDLYDYQNNHHDYFSYSEISFIFLIFKIILIEELYHLTKKLSKKLQDKKDAENYIENIEKNLKENSYIDFHKIFNDQILLKNPYYIEQLNIKIKNFDNLSSDTYNDIQDILSNNEEKLKHLLNQEVEEDSQNNILIMNIFVSLKKITKFKYATLLENISFSEQELMKEDVGMYEKMYDNNKNDYRTQIIRNAKKLHINEYQYVVDIVKKANQEKKHVGWYIFKQKNFNRRAYWYVGILTVATILLSALLSWWMKDWWACVLLIIPLSQFVIEIMNRILFGIHTPHSTFKLNFDKGIPEEYATMVIVPTIIKNKEKVKDIFEKLEKYYLSNLSDNLYFTLLGDASGEKGKHVAHDEEVIEEGTRIIAKLNKKYEKNIFNFVYRQRFYSQGENCYLGRERKRGAILDFNDLLLNNLTETEEKNLFQCQTFGADKPKITYIITLDTDTQLVLYTASKLIGAMAHPMNRAVLSKDGQRVEKGYGIMQPRVNVDVEVTSKSKYAQLFSGLGGLDVYTTASFELYQDIFDEGSFCGKGIYDLKIFQHILKGRFPNNLILSHDLLEGNHIRCGLINDVELVDDSPYNYLDDAKRHHRWTRGDWQIIAWLKSTVKNEQEEIIKNPINFISKWKIFDNLRRSVSSLAILILIFYGFVFSPVNAWYFLLIIAIVIFTPIFFFLFNRITYKRKNNFYLRYYMNLLRGIIAIFYKSFIVLSILPKEAFLYTDAIVKALYRMFVSHKNLLNWITSEEAEKMTKNTLPSYFANFKANIITSIVLLALVIGFHHAALVPTIILVAIWCFAPILMFHLGKKFPNKMQHLDDKKIEEIKQIAQDTWKYFNTYISEENNYLIPDNFQDNRQEKVDYKTSPTNIGFSLVSIVCAYELNFISESEAIGKIASILETVCKLNKWEGHLYNWYNIQTLEELPPYFVSTADSGNFVASLYVVKEFLKKLHQTELISVTMRLIDQTDFKKLYNYDIDVFSIGYNRMEQRLLPYHYNNFASEARLTSFLAIAKGDVPYKHWFCLDKTLTKFKHYKGIASWYGTLFEYFMPLVYMKTYRHTLMDETYSFSIYAQREYIKEINPALPWGISEAGYNELDDAQNYKYRAFGVPYLKFQNTISNRIVISPYSSLLTISIKDKAVYENIQKFKQLGVYGTYGFYESYDYEDEVVVKAHYAHHQGMILASLTNYLTNNSIQNYFHNDKNIGSMELLLKEKAQIKPYIDLKITKFKRYQYSKTKQENDIREYDTLHDIPEMGVLSNGYYTVVINDRGLGMSRFENIYLNRYRKITNENYGLFLYIRNIANDKLWCNTFAPLNGHAENYRVIFASDRIKFIRNDDGIVTTTEITIIKDKNAEIRKITFENTTDKDITLELTSYGEVIMAPNSDDIAHRAFNGITITSSMDADKKTLIFTRKPHSHAAVDQHYCLANTLLLEEENDLKFEYETSRLQFIGRNNTTQNPSVITQRKNLSCTLGATLDPIMSIRRNIVVKAGTRTSAYLIVCFGKSVEQLMNIIDTYNNPIAIDSAFKMATVFNNIQIGKDNFKGYQMKLYNSMLKYLFQTYPTGEERINLLKQNTLTQNNLWRFGISGDLPIIYVEINDISDSILVNEILQAYEFYKTRAIYLDVIILIRKNDNMQILRKHIQDLVNKVYYFNYFHNAIGNIYTISEDDVSADEMILFQTVARLSLKTNKGKSLEALVSENDAKLQSIANKTIYPVLPAVDDNKKPKDLVYYNGYGGFLNDGKEYYIDQIDTPTPWTNVIANQKFGFITTNSMSGFTYAVNSQGFKLTSWSNDMVSDPASEIILINKQKFVPQSCIHGLGYSSFYLKTTDFQISICLFTPVNDMVKYYIVSIDNLTDKKQNIDIDFIIRIVLGNTEEKNARHLIAEWNKEANRVYFRNAYDKKFANCHAFMSSTEQVADMNIYDPFNKSISINIDIDANTQKEFSFLLGCERDNELIPVRTMDEIKQEKQYVIDYWQRKLSVFEIHTPDKSLNYVLNNWYLYQTYASRLYARAGFYQVGGAFGFRDQLQDVMCVSYSAPEYARQQIIRHASHQFPEGDVLHWWHDDMNFGARTTFSDDYLWLIYVTYEYMRITGDYNILNEIVPYIDGDKLNEHENERGISFHTSEQKDSLYLHLKACINKATRQYGIHGLPLMGCGDWNDGMNRVGEKGKGESVWVAFFMIDLLKKMCEVAVIQHDESYIDFCKEHIDKLTAAIQQNAWDGQWFLRAFFDNGDALGSRNNMECQIDLLCQSWSLLTDTATEEQKKSIIRETEIRLVDREHNIIKLLTPPFKHSKNNPGYIMDYVEGIRENGGQYTHASMWYIMALLKEGLVDKAYQYYAMINPINRTTTISDVLKYKVEPYCIAADIYANPLHVGRGGWTWYTGSSGWAYKTGLEYLLGFQKFGDKLRLRPKIPSYWNEFNLKYRYMDTIYLINVIRTEADSQNTDILGFYLDGNVVKGDTVLLVNDQQEHKIRIEF